MLYTEKSVLPRAIMFGFRRSGHHYLLTIEANVWLIYVSLVTMFINIFFCNSEDCFWFTICFICQQNWCAITESKLSTVDIQLSVIWIVIRLWAFQQSLLRLHQLVWLCFRQNWLIKVFHQLFFPKSAIVATVPNYTLVLSCLIFVPFQCYTCFKRLF